MSIEIVNAFEAEDNAGLAAEATQEEPIVIEANAEIGDAEDNSEPKKLPENEEDPYPFD